LPSIVGDQVAKLYNLYPLQSGYATGYNSSMYAGTISEFAVAAFRLHFLINQNVCRATSSFSRYQCHGIGGDLKNTTDIHGSCDSVLRSTLVDPVQSTYPQMSYDLNNNLFKTFLSLGSLNFQRGRDVGLRGYNDYRAACNLTRASTFDALVDIRNETRAILKSLYAHVNDIDLYAGGISEIPLSGAAVGPLFACNYEKN